MLYACWVQSMGKSGAPMPSSPSGGASTLEKTGVARLLPYEVAGTGHAQLLTRWEQRSCILFAMVFSWVIICFLLVEPPM